MTVDEHFSAFVRVHTDALLKTAYLLTRNQADAEEVVQDTLVWLYPRWTQVQSAAYQLAYVRKAVVNRFLAGKRRMSASEVRLADLGEWAAERGGVRDEAADTAERLGLWQELGELSDRQRAAIVLRFFHDLPDEAVAEMLDCRVGTVRSLISRALAQLRSRGNFADDGVSARYLRNVE